MNARVVRVDVDVARRDEATAIYADMVKGGTATVGQRGGLLLVNPQTGKTISITFWNSESEMNQTEQSGWWQKQVDRFKAMFMSQPEREHYEVAFSQWPGESEGVTRAEAPSQQPGAAH